MRTCVVCDEPIEDGAFEMPILMLGARTVLVCHFGDCYRRAMKRAMLFTQSLVSDTGWPNWLNSRIVQQPLGGLDAVCLGDEEEGAE